MVKNRRELIEKRVHSLVTTFLNKQEGGDMKL